MKTLVVGPHPDDELLGCGGLLLRRAAEGGTVGWLIVTAMTEADGWSADRVQRRACEIDAVRQGLSIDPEGLFQLGLPAARLDTFPLGDLVRLVSGVFRAFQPEEVLVPHPGDVHSDHRICFDAAMACTKWFRYPSIRRILTYETISETDAMPDPRNGFQPTVFVDISKYLARKWELLKVYQSEIGDHPFPRSEKAVTALASVRGAQAGFEAAEGFCLLRERLS